jgi:hypothetical protein
MMMSAAEGAERSTGPLRGARRCIVPASTAGWVRRERSQAAKTPATTIAVPAAGTPHFRTFADRAAGLYRRNFFDRSDITALLIPPKKTAAAAVRSVPLSLPGATWPGTDLPVERTTDRTRRNWITGHIRLERRGIVRVPGRETADRMQGSGRSGAPARRSAVTARQAVPSSPRWRAQITAAPRRLTPILA